MNKLVYISLLSFGVLFVSCQKEDVTPLSSDEMLAPTWEESNDRYGLNDADQFIETGENARGGSGEGEGEGGENGAGPGGNEDPPAGGNGGITDPNEDPDGSGKGKGNK